jgi:hypothetical protein
MNNSILKHVVTHHLLQLRPNSCIIIACDNMYTIESKDELVFVEFFFHAIPLVVCN